MPGKTRWLSKWIIVYSNCENIRLVHIKALFIYIFCNAIIIHTNWYYCPFSRKNW